MLPPAVTARVAVEAGIAMRWHKLVGDAGEIVSIEHYGASADDKTLFREFGFTAEDVVAAAERIDGQLDAQRPSTEAAAMTQNPNLAALTAAGVSVWLDDLSRERLQSGNLQNLIDTKSVVGVTTNPSIFQAALSKGNAYDAQVNELAARGADVDATIRTVTTDDVRNACDVFARRTRPPTASTAGCPSRSTPGSRTTPTRPSCRPSSCGRSSTGPTC